MVPKSHPLRGNHVCTNLQFQSSCCTHLCCTNKLSTKQKFVFIQNINQIQVWLVCWLIVARVSFEKEKSFRENFAISRNFALICFAKLMRNFKCENFSKNKINEYYTERPISYRIVIGSQL